MIGELVKVHLPGESPWAEVLLEGNDMIKARIDNRLWPELPKEQRERWTSEHWGATEPLPVLHDYKYNDELWFEKGEYGEWVVVENQGQ